MLPIGGVQVVAEQLLVVAAKQLPAPPVGVIVRATTSFSFKLVIE
jgi:hypothetical protein